MSFTNIRALELEEPIVNDDLIAFSVASSEPYFRKTKNELLTRQGIDAYWEVLEISDKAIDFVRLIDQRCPFIMEHDPNRQLGVVEKAYISNDKLYVDVRFSKDEYAQKVLKDIVSGIRRNVSIGYNVNDYEMQQGIDGIPIMLVTSWQPYEASSVSCPADPTVGYKRSLEIQPEDAKDEKMNEEEKSKKACEEEEKKSEEQAEEQQEETAEAAEEAAEELTNEEKEEIRALGKAFNRSNEAESFIKLNKSLAEFKKSLNNPYKEKNIMSERKFNIARALLDKVGKIDPAKAELERNIIEENRRNFNINTNDIVITESQVRAGFDGTADAPLHPAEYRPDLYAGTLAKENTLARVGATVVPTAGESVSYAVCTSGLNGYYVDPNNPVPSGNPTFAQKTLTPHTYGSRTFISHLSQLQDRPEAAAIAMDELFKGMDFVKDVKAFQGTGTNGEPTGVLNTTGLNTVALTGTLDITKAMEFEKKIRESGDYSSDLKWVFGTEAYYTWSTTPVKTTALNEFLIDYKTGKCLGYEAVCSPAVPASAVLLGNFKELLVADFGGIKLNITQDLNYGASDAYQIAGIADNDVSVRRPTSFTKGV